jgi:predicted SAM-dependent methyltransferase
MSSLNAIKRAVVNLIGRDRANRLSSPYHDWSAKKRSERALAALPQKDLFINIGCGPRVMADWINIDIARAPGIDIVWDLRNGLPFPADSCAAIFGEHVIEHMPKEAAEKLLSECYRALQPGGVVRLSTPDAELFFRSYAGDREFLRHPAFPANADTPLDRINMMMREYGQHLWTYDTESLLLLLKRAGFSTQTAHKFGESEHARMRQIDSPERAFESLYVEGVK